MAFTVINSGEIESGDAVTEELFGKVKDNFDDHESRIVGLEGGSAVFYPFWFWHGFGYYKNSSGFTSDERNLGLIVVPFNVDVLAARVMVHIAGSSGSTEIDIKYKRGAGAWTSIFSTRPSVAFGAGNFVRSSNAVVSVPNLLASDLLRAELVSVQGGTPGPKDLTIELNFEKV